MKFVPTVAEPVGPTVVDAVTACQVTGDAPGRKEDGRQVDVVMVGIDVGTPLPFVGTEPQLFSVSQASSPFVQPVPP